MLNVALTHTCWLIWKQFPLFDTSPYLFSKILHGSCIFRFHDPFHNFLMLHSCIHVNWLVWFNTSFFSTAFLSLFLFFKSAGMSSTLKAFLSQNFFSNVFPLFFSFFKGKFISLTLGALHHSFYSSRVRVSLQLLVLFFIFFILQKCEYLFYSWCSFFP